jgi:hypothetical protein
MMLALMAMLFGIGAQAQAQSQQPKALMPKTLMPKSSSAKQSAPEAISNILLTSAPGAREVLIRNQGNPTACFAVAATSMFDAWNFKQSPKPAEYQRSSSREVFIKKSVAGGGGDPSHALEFLIKNGACQDGSPPVLECLPKSGPLEAKFGTNCVRNRILGRTPSMEVLSKRSPSQNDSESRDALLAPIHQALEQGLPALVNLCESHIQQDAPKKECLTNAPAMHSSIVIGKKCDSVELGIGCYYLVHLFQGETLEQTELAPKFRKKSNQERGLGAIWMSESELVASLAEVIILKPSAKK